MSHPSRNRIPLPPGQCRLVVIQDQLQPCPYLPDVTARMPLRLPVGRVTPRIVDQLLVSGYRRSGDFVYRTQCPSCAACQPTRILVGDFRWTKSLKRVLSRGYRDLTCRWSEPVVTHTRLDLFNRHRRSRGLDVWDSSVDADSYRSFLVDTCCATKELSIELNGQLVGVSIADVGEESLSAVYTYFDPDVDRYSLGTLAILKQIEWAAQCGRSYVYLGMYVQQNRHLSYKSRFVRQQRLIDGRWVNFDRE